MVWERKTQPLALAEPFTTLQMVGCDFLLSPKRLRSGTQVPTLTTHSASFHLCCLVAFSASTPQALFSMEEEREKKKSTENNPILIRFA